MPIDLAYDVRKQYDAGDISREICNFKLEGLFAQKAITPAQFGEAWVKKEPTFVKAKKVEVNNTVLNSMGLF